MGRRAAGCAPGNAEIRLTVLLIATFGGVLVAGSVRVGRSTGENAGGTPRRASVSSVAPVPVLVQKVMVEPRAEVPQPKAKPKKKAKGDGAR